MTRERSLSLLARRRRAMKALRQRSRLVFRVSWFRRYDVAGRVERGMWLVTERAKPRPRQDGGKPYVWGAYSGREEAIAAGRALAKDAWNTFRRLSQLVVHHKGGNSIAFEHTYGRDPRRHAG